MAVLPLSSWSAIVMTLLLSIKSRLIEWLLPCQIPTNLWVSQAHLLHPEGWLECDILECLVHLFCFQNLVHHLGGIENVSKLVLVFPVFSTSQGKASAEPLRWNAPRLYNTFNHCPCTRPAYEAESMRQSPTPSPSLQNSGSQMFMWRVRTLSGLDSNWQNVRKKNYREHSKINVA